ncbi:MAG: formylglycine-generating enzyme family protein [Acidobacteria bacterium]|nr:MAG: formylglycine-generating enzyme family protein [Acidobacteriota bacterium]
MPGARDLPDELMKLSRRNAFELSDRRWPRDVEQLITALERFFAGQQGAQRREAEAQRAREAEELKRFADLRAAINTRVHELEAEEVERQRSVERTSASSKEMPPTARLAMLPPSVEAVAHSDAQPSNVTNRVEIELVWISPGSFMMGSDKYDDEKPMHRVTISEGFYMGKYEVTQAQWQAVMGNDPSHFRGDDLPVENVSWNDTQEFINKLNAQSDGYTYRLPTEAEWEYAARAGTTGNYAGDLDAMAWYEKNSGSKTHPVGSKQPNGFGLYDMHGNVWEWVQDWYHEAYAGAPTDGSAWLSGGEQKYRVLRGGSWNSYAYNLRSANRGRLAPDYRFSLLGFRVVAVARA